MRPLCVRFELPEHWPADELERILVAARAIPEAPARVSWLLRAALSWRTPFEDESSLAVPPDGELRIRLQSMDCVTFVYYLLGMVFASTRAELADLVAQVRYHEGAVLDRNLLHYTVNVFERFVRLGYLRDVTSSLCAGMDLPSRSVRLGVLATGERFVRQGGDPNVGEIVAAPYVPTACFNRAEPQLLDGDVVLLVSAKPAEAFPAIVGHAGFVLRSEDPSAEVLLVHCSKSRVGSSDGPRAGISLTMPWDESLHALLPNRGWRTLSAYLHQNSHLFSGVRVYRATTPSR